MKNRGLCMVDDCGDEFVKIKKEELEELNSKIKEQEVILMHTKEYLFGLQSLNRDKEKSIKKLKDYNKVLKDELELYKSSTSWKITKPLRTLTNFFKK